MGEEDSANDILRDLNLCDFEDLSVLEVPRYIYLFYPVSCEPCKVIDQNIDDTKKMLYSMFYNYNYNYNYNNNNNSDSNGNADDADNNRKEDGEKVKRREKALKKIARLSKSALIVAPYEPEFSRCAKDRNNDVGDDNNECSCTSMLSTLLSNSKKKNSTSHSNNDGGSSIYLISFSMKDNEGDDEGEDEGGREDGGNSNRQLIQVKKVINIPVREAERIAGLSKEKMKKELAKILLRAV